MDSADKDFALTVLDAHPNLDVRVFNPFSRNTPRALQLVTRLGAVARRMHDKSFIANTTMAQSRRLSEYFTHLPIPISAYPLTD